MNSESGAYWTEIISVTYYYTVQALLLVFCCAFVCFCFELMWMFSEDHLAIFGNFVLLKVTIF